ncbi:ribonuclease P protein component [Fulvivirga kasyanovii]|uniref:Ribonuclease P protein component n=2 Tax=Fulvivirga kasyanovii TaxID=396812 RepID=A0ABW9RKF1_9BACT|nr:ribonuclease P protein component [Fulvivirga kasyanovii]MTI24569.1 ribonuclease P protein component [Fulvivirga kasyanovii]
MASMTFKKSERLAHKKSIQELFTRGSSFYLYPFKVIFRADESIPAHQILISVPKRSFKKAVLRNKLKRRIREAYRLNKHLLDTSVKYQIAYIYTSKDLLEFNDIERKLIAVLERLKNQLAKKSE